MRRLLPFLCLVWIGCEPDPDVEPPACKNASPGTADIGAGDLATGFVELDGGSEIRVALGPQGQHMVTVSLRIQNLELPSVGTARTPISIGILFEGELVGGTFGELPPSSIEAEMTEFLGLRNILTVDEINPLAGKIADFEATIEDGCKRMIAVKKSLRLVP